MKRRIIEIDQDKCNGCGACAEACHEGAIAMVDGKAQLMRDDYCDGLGDVFEVLAWNQGKSREDICGALREKFGEKNPEMQVLNR